MIHQELQDQFILQNLREGDSVQLTLNDGTTVVGTLSTSNVFSETIVNGETIGSRIGLFLGPLTAMQPFFSENISEITRV